MLTVVLPPGSEPDPFDVSSGIGPTGHSIVRVARRQPLDLGLVRAAADLLADLVGRGAALGWVDPPSTEDVADLLDDVASSVDAGDAALAFVLSGQGSVVGLGYWRRYARPTHRPQADLEKVAVAFGHQGRGVGRALVRALIDQARQAGIEQLTLDARGDNASALAVYRSAGFVEYGRLRDFVAVGDRRYDKTFWVIDLRETAPS